MTNRENLRNVIRETLDKLGSLNSNHGEFVVSSFQKVQNSFLSVWKGPLNNRSGILIPIENSGLPDLLFSKLQFRSLHDLELIQGESKIPISKAIFISLPSTEIREVTEILCELTIALELGSNVNELHELVRIWASALARPDRLSESTALGLWGELIALQMFNNVNQGVASWHINSNDKWDFLLVENSPIEVKTTTKTQRRHSFSSNQLGEHTPRDSLVISLQTVKTNVGTSLVELIQEIQDQLEPKSLVEFHKKIAQICNVADPSLGSFKWDRIMAVSSLRFILASKISRPSFDPPILSVDWMVNLDRVPQILPNQIEKLLRRYLTF